MYAKARNSSLMAPSHIESSLLIQMSPEKVNHAEYAVLTNHQRKFHQMAVKIFIIFLTTMK